MFRITTKINKYEQGIHRVIRVDNKIILPIILLALIYIIAVYDLTAYLILLAGCLILISAGMHRTTNDPIIKKRKTNIINVEASEPVEVEQEETELNDKQKAKLENYYNVQQALRRESLI